MNQRFEALDLLRGLTIFFMLIVNNPGSWSHVFAPLLHADWHGCTPTDLVFPFFIFIVGIAIPLAHAQPRWKKLNVKKITIRSLRICNLGLFLNAFNLLFIPEANPILLLFFRIAVAIGIAYLCFGNFKENTKLITAILLFSTFLFLAYFHSDFATLRLMGVLQRLGIVYFVASLCYHYFSSAKLIFICAGLLFAYWLALLYIPFPEKTDFSFNKGINLAAFLDQTLLKNHILAATKTFDPEGILPTLPAIAQAIIGIIIAKYMLTFNSFAKKFYFFFSIGLFLFIAGSAWAIVFPLNKILWTSSFVLFTSGLALLFLAFFHYFSKNNWFLIATKPLKIWGINPIIIFFIAGIVPRVANMIKTTNPQNKTEVITVQKYCYDYILQPIFGNPKVASLLYALLFASVLFLAMVYLYRKNYNIKV